MGKKGLFSQDGEVGKERRRRLGVRGGSGESPALPCGGDPPRQMNFRIPARQCIFGYPRGNAFLDTCTDSCSQTSTITKRLWRWSLRAVARMARTFSRRLLQCDGLAGPFPRRACQLFTNFYKKYFTKKKKWTIFRKFDPKSPKASPKVQRTISTNQHRNPENHPFPIRRIHFAQQVFPSMLFFVCLFSAPYAFMAFIVMLTLIHSG